MRIAICCVFLLAISLPGGAQPPLSKVWVADNRDGTYKNPVLHADYSDPDAIRVGNDFYLVASSFEDVPGLPILHSHDLVNWSIIGHAVTRQIPSEHFDRPRHGEGIWAPSIRYHAGEFFIYYPDPDFGIYCTKARKPEGPWSPPILVEAGQGLIDPCPLWDEDGQVYLVHAYAGSRAGIKSILAIQKLSPDGLSVLEAGKIVYDGHTLDPTVEGPKLYRRNGYYYIFAPAGGVSTGWQLALRSKNIYGPYERRVVMEQGNTPINGPHQGAWVTTASGEDWFLHFQDKGVYGRVLHLQPMRWKNDWPVIGIDKDGDGTGEPVLSYHKPNVGRSCPVSNPAESDEFNSAGLGLQWQWMANPQPYYWFSNAAAGRLRLYAYCYSKDSIANLWQTPNVLLQKLPAEEFQVTTKLRFTPNPRMGGEITGLVIMGASYAGLVLNKQDTGIVLNYVECVGADKGAAELPTILTRLPASQDIYLRIKIYKGGRCHFEYSLDGLQFLDTGRQFQAVAGRWIGAKVGIFCEGKQKTNDCGFADFDWFRVEPVDPK